MVNSPRSLDFSTAIISSFCFIWHTPVSFVGNISPLCSLMNWFNRLTFSGWSTKYMSLQSGQGFDDWILWCLVHFFLVSTWTFPLAKFLLWSSHTWKWKIIHSIFTLCSDIFKVHVMYWIRRFTLFFTLKLHYIILHPNSILLWSILFLIAMLSQKKGNMRQIFWKIEEVREKGRNSQDRNFPWN